MGVTFATPETLSNTFNAVTDSALSVSIFAFASKSMSRLNTEVTALGVIVAFAIVFKLLKA